MDEMKLFKPTQTNYCEEVKPTLMAVKEIAELFGVSRQLVSEKIKELFPNIVKNGVETKLNESQITVIKLHLERNPMLPSTVVEGLPKTRLNKALLIKQAMELQNEMIEELQKENEIMKPKAIEYDKFLNAESWLTMNEVAKSLSKGRNTLMALLRMKGVLLNDNIPKQLYMDKGYFKVIYGLVNGQKFPQTLVSSLGVVFISKILAGVEE